MELGGVTLDLSSPPFEFWGLCLGLIVAYTVALRRYGPSMVGRPDVAVATGRQKFAFVSGVVALFAVSGTPFHAIGEQALYSVHMTEHMVHAFVVAPLLLLGTPAWLFRLVLRWGPARWVATRIGRPLIAAVIFNVALALLHWPAVVDFMITDTQFHGASHLLWIVAAVTMWLPVLSPDPTLVPRLEPPARMGYIFVQSILPTVPSAMLTFGEKPMYQRYDEFDRMFGISAVHDMQLAGLIMKIGVGFLLWGIITVTFFRWANREERNDHMPVAPPATPLDVHPA